MNKKWFILALALMFLVSSADASDKRKRKKDRERRLETGLPCLNLVDETENFDNYNITGMERIVNGGIAGPISGSWSHLWLADATTGDHRFGETDAGKYDFAEHNTVSIYAKVHNNIGYIRIGLYNGTNVKFILGTWEWDGSVWGEIDLSAFADEWYIQDVGDGWFRFSVYIDGDSRDYVGDILRPYAYIARSGANEGKGLYIYGLNVTQNIKGPCVYRRNGVSNYEPLVTKRGYPNDFWYNNEFSDDLAPNQSSGLCDTGFKAQDRGTYAGPAYWYMNDEHMDLSRAWGIIRSSDAIIAIADIEVVAEHPDLIDNIWKNPLEYGGAEGIDDDGNGWIDDIYGWDTVNNDGRMWFNDIENDLHAVTEAVGERQHGSQMASIMGAQGNNEPWTSPPNRTDRFQGGVGVLWDVEILPFRTISGAVEADWALTENSIPSSLQIIAEYADLIRSSYGSKVKVINMSFLLPSKTGMQYCISSGILPVNGFGNTGNMRFPDADKVPGVVRVGAVRYTGETGDSPDGAGNGSTNFGLDIDVTGYASSSGAGYYNDSGPYWHISDTYGNSMIFTLGYDITGHISDAVQWCNAFDSNVHNDELTYGIIPTPMLTSGATAQVSGLVSMVYGLYPDVKMDQVIGMIGRGSVPDAYGKSDTQCNGASPHGGWVAWISGTAYVFGDIVQGAIYNATSGIYEGTGLYYAVLVEGTSAGNASDLDNGSDTGVDWIEIGFPLTAPLWQNSHVYSVKDVVLSSTDGFYYSNFSGGTSSGDDTDLAGGSDGLLWVRSGLKGDWTVDGLLGTGRVNAYRTITLWGAVSDTTLGEAGETTVIYVSGDVQFTGITTTFSGDLIFKIAPSDIYEDEIMGVDYQCQDDYYISGLTDLPPVAPSPAMVEIYFDGTIVNLTGATATFESNAENPGILDWGGVWAQTGTIVLNDAGITINNTTLGDYR